MTTHVDVCHANRGGVCNCAAGVRKTRRPKTRRPWRRCAACGGVCYWHDTAWVCEDDDCGSEWDPGHDPKYRAPGDES